jgi:hypothetical protein
MLFQVANAMNLSNAEKEVLGFLHGKIGHDPKANVSLRALHRHFAEIPASSFELICDGLIEKDLIGNFFLDQLVFTPEGLAVAQALQGAMPPTANAQEPAPANEHLVWDLSQMADHRKASEFVMQFRHSLCVFSGPVQQLYSNYDILVPRDNERKLTILPNPAANHDTFNFIAPDTVAATRLYIAPERDGTLQLLMPTKSGGWQPVPLRKGLQLVQEKMGDVPFLPVLTKGDLREQSPANPVLHLHHILLDKIQNLSGLELRTLRKTIQENLGEYFGFRATRSVTAPL